MIKKMLAVMLVVCVVSSHAFNGGWFTVGLAVSAGGGAMLAFGGFETKETGVFYRGEERLHTGTETKLTLLGGVGISVCFIGLAWAVFAAAFLESDKRAYAPPSPSIDPVLDIPLFALSPEGAYGEFEFGLPKAEGLRLSLPSADVYAELAR